MIGTTGTSPKRSTRRAKCTRSSRQTFLVRRALLRTDPLLVLPGHSSHRYHQRELVESDDPHRRAAPRAHRKGIVRILLTVVDLFSRHDVRKENERVGEVEANLAGGADDTPDRLLTRVVGSRATALACGAARRRRCRPRRRSRSRRGRIFSEVTHDNILPSKLTEPGCGQRSEMSTRRSCSS